MKKTYQKEKWKRHSRAVSRHGLKRKRRKGKNIQILEPKPRQFGKVRAPSIFSILDNAEEMLEFFKEIEKMVDWARVIKFDMSGIKKIKLDGILYTLSLFEYLKSKAKIYQIKGNTPEKPECKKLFEESGFYRYVNSANPPKSNSDILSILSGEKNNGQVAENVINFIKNHLKTTDEELESIYETLVECMGNTVEHAYENDAPLPKWWLVASYNNEDKNVNLTFLDNGLGIPTTARRSFAEKIKLLGAKTDGKVIISALKGEFRSKTGKEWRNKGLPRILKYLDEKRIDNLMIVSNRTIVNAEKLASQQLKGKFRGTLLSWTYA